MSSNETEMGRLRDQESAPLLDETQNQSATETEERNDIPPHDITIQARQPYCQTGVNGIFESSYAALCAAFAALAGFLFGYDQGVISIILVEPQFIHRFGQIADGVPGSGLSKGLSTAMIEIGALLGAFSQGWLADRFSRKYSIMAAAGVFVIGSVFQTSSQTYTTLLVARFIGGVGIGMLSMVAPLYISEISPPEIRGSLLVLEELSIVTGIVIAFWITYVTQYIDSEWAWRLPFLLQIFPGLLLGIGIQFLPFSPRWLVAQKRYQEALSSLSKLRQLPPSDERVVREWCDIRAEITLHEELHHERHPQLKKGAHTLQAELSSWLDLFSPYCWRRTQVGVGIMFFQQFVGINAIIYYAPTMLALLGLDHDMQLIMSGLINMAQLAGVITSVWTMDRFGRRFLLLAGSLCMLLSHLFIAIFVGSFADDWRAHPVAGWLCVALLLFYMAAFGASWGPVPWALPSEIFPSSLRAKGVAISSCSNWLNNSIIGIITPPLVQSTGWAAYAFFALFCLLSLVWTYLVVPETAGKTLEQMDHVFKDASSEQEEIRRRRIARQINASILAT